MKKMMGFLKKDDGLVAIEWVGVAAVMLVAAIAIAGVVTTGTFNAGETLATETETMADGAASQDPNCFKDGTCGD